MKNKYPSIQALKLAILTLIALPLLALQTVAAADTAPQGESVVMCAKCKTVWVNRPVTVGSSSNKGGVTVYRKEETMKCADCESAVATFFKTGKLSHDCKACGSELTHCKVH